jgi:hypothetical protein
MMGCDGAHGSCPRLLHPPKGRNVLEEMLGPKVNAPSPRAVQQQLLAVGGYKAVSSAPRARVGPATYTKLAATGDCSYGGDAAADGEDCVCGFHAETLRQSQGLCKPFPATIAIFQR